MMAQSMARWSKMRNGVDARPNRLSSLDDSARPTSVQRRYLRRGLGQPGGKLPLFDEDGREVSPRTVQSCIDRGWAEPWFNNPLKPDWLVCRLTPLGHKILDASLTSLPQADPGGESAEY